MIQENNNLLLIDLLSRLAYGVKIRLGDYDYQVCGYNSEKEMPVKICYYYDSNLTLKSYIDVYLTDYRPYLRPMSSMTEEESIELQKIINDWWDKELFTLTEEPMIKYALFVINYTLNPTLFD